MGGNPHHRADELERDWSATGLDDGLVLEPDILRPGGGDRNFDDSGGPDPFLRGELQKHYAHYRNDLIARISSVVAIPPYSSQGPDPWAGFHMVYLVRSAIGQGDGFKRYRLHIDSDFAGLGSFLACEDGWKKLDVDRRDLIEKITAVGSGSGLGAFAPVQRSPPPEDYFEPYAIASIIVGYWRSEILPEIEKGMSFSQATANAPFGKVVALLFENGSVLARSAGDTIGIPCGRLRDAAPLPGLTYGFQEIAQDGELFSVFRRLDGERMELARMSTTLHERALVVRAALDAEEYDGKHACCPYTIRRALAKIVRRSPPALLK